MKNKVIIFSLFAIIASFYRFSPSQDLDDLILANVEALSATEATPLLRCMGVGSVNCPMGDKVRRIVIRSSCDNYGIENGSW